MKLHRLAVGDVVKARIKARTVWGEVTEIKDGVVYFQPISPAAGWRHASAREIVGHWRKVGRRNPGAIAGSDEELVTPARSSSRSQTSTSKHRLPLMAAARSPSPHWTG